MLARPGRGRAAFFGGPRPRARSAGTGIRVRVRRRVCQPATVMQVARSLGPCQCRDSDWPGPLIWPGPGAAGRPVRQKAGLFVPFHRLTEQLRKEAHDAGVRSRSAPNQDTRADRAHAGKFAPVHFRFFFNRYPGPNQVARKLLKPIENSMTVQASGHWPACSAAGLLSSSAGSVRRRPFRMDGKKW